MDFTPPSCRGLNDRQSPLAGKEQLARARRPVEEVARNYVAWPPEIAPPRQQVRDQKCC